MGLLGLWFSSRHLEFNQQRATTRNPEYSVWEPSVAWRGQLRSLDAEVIENKLDCLVLDLGLRSHRFILAKMAKACSA